MTSDGVFLFDEHRNHTNIYLRVETYSRHRRHHKTVRYYRLHPHKENRIMTDVTVGHVVTDTIVYLDQNGNPMLVTPTPDSPPVWTQLPPVTPPVDSMSVSADGSTATISALAAGQDTIGVSVVVGGVTFTASQNLNIAAAPQVLTSVQIAATVA